MKATTPPTEGDRAQALGLLTAKAVRERAHEMLRLCEAGSLDHWRVDRRRLPAAADYVIAVMRENYPSLDIPFHARWRHFVNGGADRWASLAASERWQDAAAEARAAFDLAIVSVLLDAGAGADWRYRLADGSVLTRSEGLAAASFDMFASGAFSADPGDRLRADASRLSVIEAADIARGFQAGPGNPLIGLQGRAALLRALGQQAASAASVFGKRDLPRPGGLFDHLAGEADAAGGAIEAGSILAAVLTHLGPIWPSRLTLAGVALGDCWRHEALRRDDATNGLLPFHKLSQWLSYSLIEPLQWAGIEVTEIDGLTGLPEYRNGGLFIDLGVIVPKHSDETSRPHEPGSPLIVEWRALTVALLDEVAGLIRAKLGLDALSLPLAKVLEGGSWAAGRRIARERRKDGSPPLTILSDGTVF